MSRFEQITRAKYQVKLQWECEFDDTEKPELLSRSILRHTPLCTQDALYGGRTEGMRLHYKLQENET